MDLSKAVNPMSFSFDNVHLEKPRALRRLTQPDSPILRDLTCELGTAQCRSHKRHLVVIFRDDQDREVRVVIDLLQVTAEQIALMYKARWQVEVFFRWIKQNTSRRIFQAGNPPQILHFVQQFPPI